MARDLPAGTVTFLFPDFEGSTKLLHSLGAEAFADALADHHRTLRDAFTRHGGIEVDNQGDALLVAFRTAPGRAGCRVRGHAGPGFRTDQGPLRPATQASQS